MVTTIVLDIAVFLLVGVVVMMMARSVEARLTVRRRVRGEVGPIVATNGGRGSLLRRDNVNNPVLAWVQDSSLNDPKERNKLRRDLTDAGFPSSAAPAIYVLIRFGLAAGLPILFVVHEKFSATPATGMKLVVIILILAGIALIVPRAFVDNRAAARRSDLEHQFPDALDLLVVCVEAGLALEASFIRVGDETEHSHPRISQEFRIVSQELRAGRTREEALRALADRCQVDAVKSFVALLIQTNSLGVSIAQSLRTYSREMRTHRMLKAEEKAMRVPVLMTLPLIGFILPVMIEAVMLPPMIDAIRHLMPVLHKG